MSKFKKGDIVSFKLKTLQANTARRDWSLEDNDPNRWIKEGIKTYKAICTYTSGRGWAQASTPHILKAGEKKIEAEVVDVTKYFCIVRLLDANDGELETLDYSKRPYVRVDGTSAPQVISNPQEMYDEQYKLKNLYGIFPQDSEWLKESNEALYNAVNGSYWCNVASKDLVLEE